RVGVITPGGGITEYSLSSNSRPEDIVAGPDGNLWVTEAVGNRIARVSTSGAITEFALPSSFSVPWSIALGADGNLWFTESGAGRIGRITTMGLIREFPISGPTQSRPTDIVSGPDGYLWWTGCSGNNVGRITQDGVITEFLVPTANCIPTGIAVGPDRSI